MSSSIATVLINGELVVLGSGTSSSRFKVNVGSSTSTLVHVVLRIFSSTSSSTARVVLTVPTVGFCLPCSCHKNEESLFSPSSSSSSCASGTFRAVSSEFEVCVEWVDSPVSDAEKTWLKKTVEKSAKRNTTTNTSTSSSSEPKTMIRMKSSASSLHHQKKKTSTNEEGCFQKQPPLQLSSSSSSVVQVDAARDSSSFALMLRNVSNWNHQGQTFSSSSCFVTKQTLTCLFRIASSAALSLSSSSSSSSCPHRNRHHHQGCIDENGNNNNHHHHHHHHQSGVGRLFLAASERSRDWRSANGSVTFSSMVRFIQKGAGKDLFEWERTF